ncbi:hypothetical protein L1987_53042 [Smallanthus sonchifolius]|uniref:Uncharacterized protein n=1 Tax=Smallanthus sonchifolius TaxID=185202 RepID=A0ACB9EVF2_9ASTR|nr:hypothetical protein L1987_53042 [Smallanthus sonchifolius]
MKENLNLYMVEFDTDGLEEAPGFWFKTVPGMAILHFGPVGRVLEADLRAGDKEFGMCYTYSCSKGPVGRVLEADLRAGDKEFGMCYTYSCSKVVLKSNPNHPLIINVPSPSFSLLRSPPTLLLKTHR